MANLQVSNTFCQLCKSGQWKSKKLNSILLDYQIKGKTAPNIKNDSACTVTEHAGRQMHVILHSCQNIWSLATTTMVVNSFVLTQFPLILSSPPLTRGTFSFGQLNLMQWKLGLVFFWFGFASSYLDEQQLIKTHSHGCGFLSTH